MNNFDDLFEQQPQKNLPGSQSRKRKSRKNSGGSSARKKQRKEAYATLDKKFGEFSEGRGRYESISGCAEPVPLPLCP